MPWYETLKEKANASVKIVLKAELTPTRDEFNVLLECNHVLRTSIDYLRGKLLCHECLGEKLREEGKENA